MGKAQIMAEGSTGKSTGQKSLGALLETACEELMTYGVWDTKTRIKRWVKKYLFRRQTPPEDLIFWPTGLLAEGLWHCRQQMKSDVMASAAQIDKALASYYERWIRGGCKVAYLDDLLAGETLLSIYEEYRESGRDNDIIGQQNAEAYRAAVEKLAAYACAYPTDEMGNFPYRAAQNNGFVFVDAIGLACPFLYRYGTVTEQPEMMETAVKQIVNFFAYGMDGATGLPYHGYTMKDGCKYGIIGWGRAVGWLLRGMSGCMETEYGRERLRDAYVDLVDTTLKYQRKDGYFSWQLQAFDGPADTSATGMICVALRQGIERGILSGTRYEEALAAGRSAVARSTREGSVYGCSGECEGFGQYPQRYGAYPWSLGPALMLQ